MKSKVALVGLGVLAACGAYTKTEYSEVMTEPAKVVQCFFSPKQHGHGTGVALGFDGQLGIASVDTNIPEKYAVVFQCQHGKFVIESEEELFSSDYDKAKQLWQKLREGQDVTIKYREIYKVTYAREDTDGNGKNDILKMSLVDYDFIDAN